METAVAALQNKLEKVKADADVLIEHSVKDKLQSLRLLRQRVRQKLSQEG
jgi:hypothetical protein